VKSSRSKPPTPNLVSVAGWVLLAISAGWVALLVYTTVSLTTTHLPRLSTWHSSTLVEAQAYYPVLFLMLCTLGNVVLHSFCTVAFIRGYRWAAVVLSVSLVMGIISAMLIMLSVGAMLATLNGAPSQEVEFLLSTSSPLYTPVYIAGGYLVVCVIALALVWSRQSRPHRPARPCGGWPRGRPSLLYPLPGACGPPIVYSPTTDKDEPRDPYFRPRTRVTSPYRPRRAR